jgi:hypothetical protein
VVKPSVQAYRHYLKISPKELRHRLPRAFVRLFDLSRPFGIVIARVSPCKGMDGAAAFDELPVQAASAHFFLNGGNARVLLRKYMWRAFFTDRYERAAATAALQDYRALRKVIAGRADPSIVPCLNETEHPLPVAEALIQARWPKRRDRLARAILLVSLRGGAQDIADGATVSGQLSPRSPVCG